MERAHVLVRLRGGPSSNGAVGLCRTSATSVRLEHSEMSPGVASISFEQVFDADDSNSHVFQRSLTPAVDSAIQGRNVTLIATGAPSSGKSFACHGDHYKSSNQRTEPGLITLAIRRIFSELETLRKGDWKCNVLLSCWSVGQSAAGEIETLTDAIEGATCLQTQDVEQLMVQRSVVVSTPAEAVHMYYTALYRVQDVEKQGFVVALHVETLSPSGEAHRGRLLVVDVHGGSIIEPRGVSTTEKTEKKEQLQHKYLLDTQFPVHEALSASFGTFVGNSCSTYVLVAIQTPAQFQQQAIQSLLYACKAKEIKGSSCINYLSSFAERDSNHSVQKQQSMKSDSSDCTVNAANMTVPIAVHLATALDSTMPVSASTTSSETTSELPDTASSSCEYDGLPRQSTVTMRVRKAYDIAKAATSSPAKTDISSTSAAKRKPEDDAALHVVADSLLRHLSWETLRSLTLQAKLEQIRTAQFDLERALAHETSIKDKCVDRISRLSQTMSCQVVEHEQQLHEALSAKHTAESQLQETNDKFEEVGREVTRLKEQISVIRSGQKHVVNVSKETQCDSAVSDTVRGERAMLHTLSTRLEEAMAEAQDVVKFKDSVIKSLEERLQLASKRGADAVTLLEEERNRFELEKAALLDQVKQRSESSSSKANEEIANVKAESMRFQQQKADLTVKVAQITLEFETARSQWAQDIRDCEKRAEQRCVEQVVKAEQQHERAADAMQQQMAQFRTELDMKVARQRVVAQVACKAGELKREQLERDLKRLKMKLSKQKVKLEKKTRDLVANARKQHEKPVAALERELEGFAKRLETVRTREQDAIERLTKSEENVEHLQNQISQLQTANTELEQERDALRHLCNELKADKDKQKTEFEQRTCELKQLMVRQVETADARVHAECAKQVQQLKEEHKTKLEQLEASRKHEAMERVQEAAKLTRTTRHHSSSSVSSRTSVSGDEESSSSDSRQQQSIDDLDELIGSKERRYKRAKQRKNNNLARSPSSSPPTKMSSSSNLKRTLMLKEEQIAELTARQSQLLAALATANEQETLAKKQILEAEGRRHEEMAQYEKLLQQLNSVKKENWNLSFALHVTETTNQQQNRCPQQCVPSRTNSYY